MDTLATQMFLSASDSTNLFLIIVLVMAFSLSMVSGGALQGFMWYLRSLQLIIHLPLMQTILPSNVSAFFEAIIPIVTFDILADYTDWMF